MIKNKTGNINCQFPKRVRTENIILAKSERNCRKTVDKYLSKLTIGPALTTFSVRPIKTETTSNHKIKTAPENILIFF